MIQKKKKNYRVVVWPEDRDFVQIKRQAYYLQEITDRCEKIKRQIARHVDNYANIEIVHDTEYFCEFCGGLVVDETDWECCDASVEEHERIEEQQIESLEEQLGSKE